MEAWISYTSGLSSTSFTAAKSALALANLQYNQATFRCSTTIPNMTMPIRLNARGNAECLSENGTECKALYANPSAIGGLVGWYDGDSWETTPSMRWRDKSGVGNHVTIFKGTPTLTNSTIANGTTKAFKTLQGGRNDGLTFPTTILPATYTLFTVARYPNTTFPNASRIFDGTSGNWLSGFWGGNIGVAHHAGWVSSTDGTQSAAYPLSNWSISSDMNDNYWVNGVPRKVGSGNGTTNLTINNGQFSNATYCTANPQWCEASAWQVGLVLVYNRKLTDLERISVEKWIANTYGITSTSTSVDCTSNILNTYTFNPIECDPRTYTLESNKDYSGNDLEYFNGAFTDCANRCNSLPNCVGYVLHKDNGRNCWMKRTLSGNGSASTIRDTYRLNTLPSWCAAATTELTPAPQTATVYTPTSTQSSVLATANSALESANSAVDNASRNLTDAQRIYNNQYSGLQSTISSLLPRAFMFGNAINYNNTYAPVTRTATVGTNTVYMIQDGDATKMVNDKGVDKYYIGPMSNFSAANWNTYTNANGGYKLRLCPNVCTNGCDVNGNCTTDAAFMYGPDIASNTAFRPVTRTAKVGNNNVYMFYEPVGNYTKMVDNQGNAKYYVGPMANFKASDWNTYTDIQGNYKLRICPWSCPSGCDVNKNCTATPPSS